MPRRKAWHGRPPASTAEARRRLLDAACASVERLGAARAGLTDVATEAGVTRQTVYRYFRDVDHLFRSAAALSSGGFLERLRARSHRETTLAARIVECMVFAIRELPRDPWLGRLGTDHDSGFGPSSLVDLGFVQEEIILLAGGTSPMPRPALDQLAELLVRLLHSYLADPGPDRTDEALRTVLCACLSPVIHASVASENM